MGWTRSRSPSQAVGWLATAVSAITTAVAAGLLPDLIKGTFGDSVVRILMVIGGALAILAVVKIWQQRRRGVGIVVVIQAEPGRSEWNTQWSDAAKADARGQHESCFTVTEAVPELVPGATPADNRERARQRRTRLDHVAALVSARLVEATSAEPAAPVSLYVNARLPEAFQLGSAVKFNVSPGVRTMGDDSHDAGTQAGHPAAPVRVGDGLPSTAPATPAATAPGGSAATAPVRERDLVVAQRSERPKTTFYPALRLSGRLKDPLTAQERERALRLVSVDPAPDFAADPAGEALALVVHLAPNPRMVTEALDAAGTGCLDVTGAWARCRGALVVSGGPANLPEDMEVFELVTRFVYAEWTAWVGARDDQSRLTQRLFAATPAAIGVALGWLFGHAMTPVPHKYVYERLADQQL